MFHPCRDAKRQISNMTAAAAWTGSKVLKVIAEGLQTIVEKSGYDLLEKARIREIKLLDPDDTTCIMQHNVFHLNNLGEDATDRDLFGDFPYAHASFHETAVNKKMSLSQAGKKLE
jgi:hypothetical protein